MKKIFYFLISLLFLTCTAQKDSKIHGISFVAPPEEITSIHIQPVVEVGANWAAVMPFGFLRNLESPEVVFNIDQQWWGEREEGAKQTIELLQKQHIEVMLKPQIWVWNGEFTGDIAMNSEGNWKILEKSYKNFILLYAKVAEEMKVPVFCIGTELHTFVQTRPDYWKKVIADIRAMYSGKLTYAENWDQFEKVPFLFDLDYIGIDAYFPLSDQKTPSVMELKESWQPYKSKIYKLHQQTQKPVLFTEYGYRSMDYTAKQPWNAHRTKGAVNTEAQKLALQAIYEEFWKEPWFAGGFLWKWYHNHTQVGGPEDNRFTIQNKPAQRWFQRTPKQ